MANATPAWTATGDMERAPNDLGGDLDNSSCDQFSERVPDDTESLQPPIAADGLPVRVGETVYGQDGKAWEVTFFLRAVHGNCVRELRPELLTHERPDSWERLESDITYYTCGNHGDEYCDSRQINHGEVDGLEHMCFDFVARARRLAESEAL